MSFGPRAIVVLFVMAPLLGACSRNDSTRLSTGEAQPSSLDDRAVAQQIQLGVTDLPGYDTAPPPPIGASGARAAGSFQSCAGAAAALGDADRSAASPGFYKGRTTMVSSVAIVAADEGEAEQAMADLSRSDVARCLTTLFKEALGLDLLAGTTTRTELLPAAKVSDQSITWRTTIQVASAQGSVSVYSDLTFFRTGRTVAALFNVQVGDPFPSAERARLLGTMVERTP